MAGYYSDPGDSDSSILDTIGGGLAGLGEGLQLGRPDETYGERLAKQRRIREQQAAAVAPTPKTADDWYVPVGSEGPAVPGGLKPDDPVPPPQFEGDSDSFADPSTMVGRRIHSSSPGGHATEDKTGSDWYFEPDKPDPLTFEWGKDVELGANGRPTTDTMVGGTDVKPAVQAHESRGGGGFMPSQTDWSKVANPMAFEAYRQQPEVAARIAATARAEALAKDPWAEERAKAGIEGAAKVATYGGERRIDAAQESDRVQHYQDIGAREARLVQRISATPEFRASAPEVQARAIAKIREAFAAERDAADRGYGKIAVKGGTGAGMFATS